MWVVIYRDKRQVSSDHVESGRYLESDVEVGRHHPWKLQNRFSNAFRATEREEFDTAFFHVPGKQLAHALIDTSSNRFIGALTVLPPPVKCSASHVRSVAPFALG